MGMHHQKNTETDRVQKRRPQVSDHDDWRGTEPSATLALSPAAIMKLQRTIGNQAVQRLLAGSKSNVAQQPKRQIGSGVPTIQRDVLSDVRIDSDDFWVNMRSRVFTRYVSWIGDARAKLAEFNDVMDDSAPTSAWANAFKSWLGVFGTPGDLVNAVIDTLGAVASGMEAKSTLERFSKEAHRKLDALSEKVNNLQSDMPVYRTLSEKEREEKSRFTERGERGTYRLNTRSELERALGLLPNTAKLYQELTLNWTLGGNKWFDDASAFIYYSSSYKTKPFGTGYYVHEVSPGTPYLRGVEQPRNTLRALQNAFGGSQLIHQLPIQFKVRFFETSGYGVGTFVKKQHAWIPDKGLGSEKLQDIFDDWLTYGKKPTIAELQTG